MTENVSRRSVLRVAGTVSGIGALGAPAAATAGPEPYVVGTGSPAAERAARSRAESVSRELDFGDIGRAVAGRFSANARRSLQKRSDVRYVEPDGEVRALGQTLPWGIDRVDADVAHSNGETGNGADVAIIDTGIDSDHPDLEANLGKGYAVETCSGSNCTYDWDDDNDHGTHCAGIAAAVNNSEGVVGVSTEATLHAVKVLDSNGSGTFSGVAEGVKWVADQGYDVGSMSLGASSGSSTIKDACQYAYDKGVLLVGAAGNDGPCTDCVQYPAAYSTVVAVTATERDDDLASWSCTGPEVELAAPGASIYSTVVGGYDTFSGTSMACPHISGAGGTLMANGYTHTEARDRLHETAEDIGLSSNEQGHGLLDVEAALADSGGETSVAVSTGSAGSVGETSATLNGDLTDLGGASSADCYFEHRERGTSTWSSTSAQTLSSTGSFSQDVSGLSSGTDYEYRAVADVSDGDTDTGSTVSFTTNSSDTSVAVATDSETDVGETSATLNGDLTDLGGADSADCYLEWGESGGSLSNTTSAQTLSSTGSFSQDTSGLSSGMEYEFRAVADASDGDADTGSILTFTTDSSSTAPAIDSYTVTEGGSPNPHAEITADWAVSDGDLDTVLVEVFDSSGSLVDSARTNVSDSSASGTDEFKIKHRNNETFDVRLTVTDAAGNDTSRTKTVSS